MPENTPAVRRGRALRGRLALWVLLCIAVLVGETAWMILLRGDRLLDDQVLLAGGWLGIGAALLLIFALLKTTPRDAIRVGETVGVITVLLGAAWLQIAALLLMPPALSDDVLRYRADGKLWLLAESPYAETPRRLRTIAAEDDELAYDVIDAATPYQDTHSLYLPVSQAAFVAGTAFEVALLPEPPATEPDTELAWRDLVLTLPWWQRLVPMRLVFGLCALLTTAVLMRMLVDARRSVWWAALFGWHPLVVVEAAGMGHQDFLGVLLLALALRRSQRDRATRSGLLLGLAVLVKPHVVLLLPWLMRRVVERSGWRRALRVPAAMTLAIAAAMLLVMPWGGGFEGWWAQFRAYALGWEANGGFYRLVKEILPQHLPIPVGSEKTVARWLGAALVLAAMIVAWIKRAGVVGAAYVLLLSLMLVAPTVYPWYLAWGLMLVPLVGTSPRTAGLSMLVWSTTVVLSYQLWHEPAWLLPWPVLGLEYLPVVAAVLIELILLRRHPVASQLARRPLP